MERFCGKGNIFFRHWLDRQFFTCQCSTSILQRTLGPAVANGCCGANCGRLAESGRFVLRVFGTRSDPRECCANRASQPQQICSQCVFHAPRGLFDIPAVPADVAPLSL